MSIKAIGVDGDGQRSRGCVLKFDLKRGKAPVIYMGIASRDAAQPWPAHLSGGSQNSPICRSSASRFFGLAAGAGSASTHARS